MKNKDKDKFDRIKNLLIAIFCTAISIQGSRAFFASQNRQELSFYTNPQEAGSEYAVLSEASVSDPVQEQSGLININSASSELLQELKGIGPSKAGAIIEYREAYGGFAAKEELMEVKGIGPATYDKIKDYITLE